MAGYPRAVARLVEALERLPGIGPKSAQRLALWMLRQPSERVTAMAQAFLDAVTQVHLCEVCGFFAETDRCTICADPRREAQLVCVVADARELLAIEQTGQFPGLYHVLGGVLSPLDGIGPEELSVAGLLDRVGGGTIGETILALNPTPEGDTTAAYLARLLKPRGVRVTRPAMGLPVGGELSYADKVTLERALAGRQEL
ncbi:MAG: recombination protein RecR [Fimbriimonadaceae bacterium]|nr:recombination protein RecR [Fimbriimonadaceae bacterium]